MSTDEILDRILVPRPNGSEGFFRVASFLESALREHTPDVALHTFTATPHGFQLVWSAALALVLAYAAALVLRRYGLALALAITVPTMLLAEFEMLRSPVSGLLPLPESNIIGTFPGRASGPTLIFCAHYDTTTHFGDHLSWGPWGWRLGPATALAIGLALSGLWQRRRGRELPRRLAVPAVALVLVPFGAMAWFHAVGPLVREPSPGALDNGGSVAALLHLAALLEARPSDAATTVKLVFLAAEEERALGSWAHAKTLVDGQSVAVINLESIGASEALAIVPEDGFALRRYASPRTLIDVVNRAALEALGAPLPAMALPGGTFTDGRSFLAHGVPAVTLRAVSDGAFPRSLHSARDSRDRLRAAAIEQAAALLLALVERVDRNPSELANLRKRPRARLGGSSPDPRDERAGSPG